MSSCLRDSGISSIGEIPWGTHIGQLYSSTKDYYEIAMPYIQSGLNNNELCVWIYSQNTSYDEIRRTLRESAGEIDPYLESGQLRLIPYTEWYICQNSFNELRVNRQWNELIRHSLQHGFDGLRAIADTSWLKKSYMRDFMNYENNINRIISELPFIVICLYDVNKLDPFEIAEILKNHSYIITRYEDRLELVRNVELQIKSRQLEESQEKYANLIRLLPDSVFIHDARRIYYCNEAALQITGRQAASEILGMSMLDFIPREMKCDFIDYINKAMDRNRAMDRDMGRRYIQSKFIGKNGEIKDVEIISTVYDFYGTPSLLSVVRDITPFQKINEMKMAIRENEILLKNAQEYDAMKMEFFSNISHELKTPLNVILSAIQLLMLQNGQDSHSLKDNKYLKVMQQNCFRLLRLVNNIIDMTKIESGYFEIKLQNFNIVELVENITMSVVVYARNKGINIAFDADTEDKVIACDPDQIERIMLNLLSNAIKFTDNGGNIMVNLHDHRDRVEIIIKDTGIGIPLDKQKCIFDRFQRVESSPLNRHEGSGIGLSLVKALVEKHNGKITLNSQPGKGSEFIVELPCRVIAEAESKPDSLKDCSELDSGKHGYVNHDSASHDSGKLNSAENIRIELSDIYT